MAEALARMVAVADSDENAIPAMLEACRAEATLGEICDALRELWGGTASRPASEDHGSMDAVLWTVTVWSVSSRSVRPGPTPDSSNDWRLSGPVRGPADRVRARLVRRHAAGRPGPHDVAQEIAEEVRGTYDGVFSTPSLSTVEQLAEDKSEGDVTVRERGWEGDDHRFELSGPGGADPVCLTVTVPHELGHAKDPIEVATSVDSGACE